MKYPDWIGWLSSIILLVTIGRQIYKQWSEESSHGVSRWFYLGQFSAQIGFIVYSFAVKNWVFVFTNSILLLENIVGLGIVIRHKRKKSKDA
jgi:MtN3 and saliva related transmembrane protein